MADKTVADLPALQAVSDETLIPVYQPGAANPAQKMKGQIFRQWAEANVKPYSDRAVQAALTAAGCEAGAQEAWTGVQNAIKNIPAGSTPIVNDLTTGGTKMALSAEQGKVLGRKPNPNLLDNWYFGDPVDQRGGWLVKSGAPYFALGGSTVAGTTNAYYPVTRWAGTPGASNAVFAIGGVSHVTDKANTVRGSIATGYTIDRWYNIGNRVSVESDGLLLENTATYISAFRQMHPMSKYLGKTITVSMLAEGSASIQIATGTGINTNYVNLATSSADSATGVQKATVTIPKDTTAPYLIVGLSIPVGKTVKAQGVKLELGSVQTIAHQDESGKWVLNEIPDKNEELLKCCMSMADAADAYANNNKTAAAVNALALDGSNTMSRQLEITQNGISTRLTPVAYGAQLSVYKEGQYDVDMRWLVLAHSAQRPNVGEALRFNYTKDGVGNSYTVLHEGNKPTGSYTGNGSAAARTINTNGIGDTLMLWGNGWGYLVTPEGGIGLGAVSGTVYTLKKEECYFNGGVLFLSTATDGVNKNNVTYHYQVL